MNKFQLLKQFKEGSQRWEIMNHLVRYGKLDVWKVIAPSPQGLGVAQYNARIKEIRDVIEPLGWEVANDPGKSFELKERVRENGNINLF